MSEWRVVPGFCRYEISDAGELRTSDVRHPMKWQRVAGYLATRLWADDGRRRRVYAHRAVALAFIGQPPTPSHEAAHGDGNRLNNAAPNLRWATPKENSADRFRHGTQPYGESHHHAILSDAQVAEIRAMYTGAVGQAAAMAAEFGVSRDHIRMVAYGVSRKSPGGEATRPEEPAGGDVEKLREALTELVSLYSQRIPLREHPEVWAAARAALASTQRKEGA